MKPIAQGRSTKTLTIRLNEGQIKAIKEQAQKKQLSQSEYLLTLVEEDMNKSQQDENL